MARRWWSAAGWWANWPEAKLTGGASGIGLARARAFSAAGDNWILVCGRDAAKLAPAKAELPGPATLQADVTDAEDRERIAATLEAELGSLSMLVNNAGVRAGQDYAAGRADEAAPRHEIETDLVAPMLLTARVMPLLRMGERESGLDARLTLVVRAATLAGTAPLPLVARIGETPRRWEYGADEAGDHIMRRSPPAPRMSAAPSFLPELAELLRTPRQPLQLPPGATLRGYLLGQGNPMLEVLLLDTPHRPRPKDLRRTWKDRQAGRAAPLLAIALHGEDATICGPAGEEPRVFDMQAAQAERLSRRALEEPDRNAALRYLMDALPASQTDTELPGLRNEGLLTDHLLRHADTIPGFAEAQAQGLAALGKEDTALLGALGFGLDRLDAVTHVLRAGDRKRALAVLLRAEEVEEIPAERFQQSSPIAWALQRADAEGLPWVVMVQRDRVRLYPRELGVGVGRRGRTETWIEVRTDLLRQDHAALLWLVFSARALAEGGSMKRLLDDSKRFAAELADRLRDRIYDRVVPLLATGIARARGLTAPTAEDLRLTYAMALTVLFRLLFVAYAEDRDLLPYAANASYRDRALKTRARRMHEEGAVPGPADAAWREVGLLFDAVREGNAALGVPAYGGRLFETDPAISPAGAELARISLPDSVFVPALAKLLLDWPADLAAAPAGPVDFRSLRVREFGTIYEGLLESELAVAEDDLALKRQGKEEVYVPARRGEAVAIARGGIYLHGRSGARKSSGSYFTPGFAVDHLLDAALAPALEAHAARITALEDEREAAEAFFDFRLADIAMGSGHFLVAAMDRVEQVLSALLVKRPLPGVEAELAALREAAAKALGPLAETARIDRDALLRRQIALRCIYGVDLNPLAVDLARLSVWVHSFVPGLPLALLDDHLVRGNALVGVGTVRELEEKFAGAGMALFPVDAKSLLGPAEEALRRRARLSEASIADVERARNAAREAQLALGPTRALCDIVVGQRVAPDRVLFQFETWEREQPRIQSHKALRAARAVMEGLDVLHLPVAFPEVFLRRNPGFDAILGNPPWEKVKVEEHAFWARHFPGLRGLSAKDREARMKRLPKERLDLAKEYAKELAEAERLRDVLGSGLYPGMGAGDPDLYKAFAWRFWNLAAAERGQVGVVLPRSVLSALGTEGLRRAIFGGSEWVDIVTVTNRGGWVFEEVHGQFTVTLLALRRGEPAGASVALRGPYASEAAWRAGRAARPHRFAAAEVLGWTSSASIPMLPHPDSAAVFAQLRKAPRLDLKEPGSWRARPDTELHATADKALMEFAPQTTRGLWPVMKGESFDIWRNDLGPASYYAWARPDDVRKALQASRLRSARSQRGAAHAEFPPDHLRKTTTLPCQRPRIAFRDVSRATDTRTMRAALIPAKIFCAHQAPYFLWPSGDEKDQAFLLGVLCSIPLDWYARRLVENHLTYFILNLFPIPRPPRSDPHWQRAVSLAGRLAAPDDRFADWAQAVGVAHGPLDEATKQAMIEELDAVVARLYGLSPDQLAHIFDTFHDWPREEERRVWTARRDRTIATLRALA